MNQMDDTCLMQDWSMQIMRKHTFERETDGNETPIKYPKTIPMTVVIISRTLSFDFLETPLQTQ